MMATDVMRAKFAAVVTEGVAGILKHQQADGSIIYDPAKPFVYPQQAIMPLAFCYAGMGTNPEHKKSPVLAAAIHKLGDFLVSRCDVEGKIHWDSNGHDVNTVDQRLVYAWVEALRMLREAGGDFAYDKWSVPILAACKYLRGHRMEKLVGVRRFISRVLGTSTNHAALYVTTVYRTGEVLGRRELCDFALPIGRALAADVHPDGYWEEHGDLLRTGGPTPSYNYLTHCGMALMAEWTGEAVFAEAVEKSTKFHADWCYPDATFVELIDERVRHDVVARPRVWGLFAFSKTASGRGMAMKHFDNWLSNEEDRTKLFPEALARHCENYLYWKEGPMEPAPFERRQRQAKLTMPAAIYGRGSWCVGLSAIPAINPEDPAYRDNPFGLDRQKLLSVWHEKVGLVLDGSPSKHQPENSTFSAPASYALDFYPSGGTVGEEGGLLTARAAYKTFYGEVKVKVVSDSVLEIELGVDWAGNRGPFTAGFTMRRFGGTITGVKGGERTLGEETFALTGAELGGGFSCGPVKVTGPAEMKVTWPFSPFNCYAANGKSAPEASLIRVHVELTPEKPRVKFLLTVG